MKSRLIRTLCAMGLGVGAALVGSVPAQAATPAIQITKVYYDSPGTDTGSNASLNAEYVRLTNTRTYSINLKNWTLRDRSGHIYRFTTDVRVAGKHSIYIHTGRGTNTSTHRYWGSRAYIWNNTGDTAYVRNPSGSLIDSCSWGRGGSYTYC